MKNNTPQEIQVILANIQTVLETVANKFPQTGDPDSAPIQKADLSKEEMYNLLHNVTASIKGLHNTMSSMANDMYSHIYDPMHLPKMKNYEHMDYACKQLGFNKEAAIRHAAYASKKVIIG